MDRARIRTVKCMMINAKLIVVNSKKTERAQNVLRIRLQMTIRRSVFNKPVQVDRLLQ